MQARRIPLGAIEKDDGSVVVPESRRADGTIRKEVRIRKGFVPQDEQPVYRPRARRAPAETDDATGLADAMGKVSLAPTKLDSPVADEEETKPAPRTPSLQERARQLPMGAVETADGEVVIPSTQRADGTFRKEIKIRKGFVPQDEQPLYRPRSLRQAASAAVTPPARGSSRNGQHSHVGGSNDAVSRRKPRTNGRETTAAATTTPELAHPNRRRHIEL
ncbi:hypothetical protein ACHHYP_20095 [Achlya hypogyna]|uniref:WIBG Mago-binding domain-containing protein n=1 Tax=Achlya hypogyna TaxID=1202772 RepID=A0A1V9Z6Q2_ACHHY|nr:hypothetical protein ACHHYP_20095 [Achlya hypogyna]